MPAVARAALIRLHKRAARGRGVVSSQRYAIRRGNGPVESASRDIGRSNELTNAEARQGAGSHQLLFVVDRGTRQQL
jgi:hypothetical protein